MSLHLIFGGMFSGKSEQLLRMSKIHRDKGLNCILVNYKGDTRYGINVLSTHTDSYGNQVKVEAICCSDLNDIREDLFIAHVIGIDEIQFFPDCVALILKLIQMGKKIFVAGLDADFKQKPFPGSCLNELIPYAQTVEKLLAVCDFCPIGEKPHKAPMSWRTADGTETKVVGGSDKYGAICHHCLAEENKVRRVKPKPV